MIKTGRTLVTLLTVELNVCRSLTIEDKLGEIEGKETQHLSAKLGYTSANLVQNEEDCNKY